MTFSFDPHIISKLIGLVYAAGRDPAQWQKAIDAITDTVPGVTGHLQGYDQFSKTMPSQLTSNMTDEALKPFVERVPEINLWWDTMGHLPVGQALSTDVHCPIPTIQNSEFYTDWLHPNDIASCVGCFLFREDSRMAALGFHYSEKQNEVMTPKVMELVTLLAPHMQTAMEMNRELLTGHNATEKLIDKLKKPAFLLESDRQILYMNPAAEQVLQQQRGWRSNVTGKLDLLDRQQAHPFARLVKATANVHHLREPNSLGILPFELDSETEKNPNTAFVTPALNGGFASSNPLAFLLGEQYAQALVVLTFRKDKNKETAQHLSKVFPDLTPTEIKIMAALTAGETLEDYARSAGVVVGTPRKQLKEIFKKTGTGKQGQLVALAAKLIKHDIL